MSPETKPRKNTIEQTSQALAMVKVLVERPLRPKDLAEHFHVSRRTIERLLHTLEEVGFTFTVKRDGRDAFYSLKKTDVRRAFGL